MNHTAFMNMKLSTAKAVHREVIGGELDVKVIQCIEHANGYRSGSAAIYIDGEFERSLNVDAVGSRSELKRMAASDYLFDQIWDVLDIKAEDIL